VVVCALLLAGALLVGCAEQRRPRNAILIVLDTLRADRLSAYGHERPTTPVIDSLAERGVLFEAAVSNASWTLPAMVGLLSGRYPTESVYDVRLRESLIERLRDADLQTAAFTGGGLVGAQFGMNLGFDFFHEQIPLDLKAERGTTAPHRQGDDEKPLLKGIKLAFSKAVEWIDENRDAPFFVLIHTYEPHTPYRRLIYTKGMERGGLPATYEVELAAKVKAKDSNLRYSPAELAYIRALYDGGVNVSDQYIGLLTKALERLGIADETLIVVTADHGEDLGERVIARPGNHGHALWDSLVMVPLVFFDPTRDVVRRRVADQVRLIDTLPTILDLLGIESPPVGEGRSLVPMMEGEETGHRIAWSAMDVALQSRERPQSALRSGTHKLIVSAEAGLAEPREIELYDLVADPREERNVAGENPDHVDRLMDVLESIELRMELDGVPDFDPTRAIRPAVAERLRELGYLE
jgi:arylsulfatase A-like enzyme